MLVLTRKMGEEIVIGDNIKLVVNRIAGNRVTIGINAPENVAILRGELNHGAVQQEAGKPHDRLLGTA
jgi:carbon storage regulator